MLLGQDNIDSDKPDKKSQTPLWWTTYSHSGNKVVVKKRRRWELVNSEKPSKSGRMPVFQAPHIGYEGVMEILLGQDDINSDMSDEHSKNTTLPVIWLVRLTLSHFTGSSTTSVT